MVLALALALGLLLGGTLLLVRGADWFIDGVSDLARLVGVSAVVLGAVLAGLEPEEMLTAAIASGRGVPQLAVGNVLGTNITIVTLALGLSALLAPIPMHRAVRRQAVLATLVSAVPVGLLVYGFVSRLAGLLLLLLFAGYTLLLFRTDPEALAQIVTLEEEDDAEDGEDGDAPAEDDPEDDHGPGVEAGVSTAGRRRLGRLRLVALTLGGLLAMAVGGPALVDGALRLAGLAGVSGGVVGLTIVSLGTGAEMVALGVSAARKHQAGVLVGGILGSFAYNLLVTLGLAAVVRPLPIDPHLTRLTLPVMVAVHLVLLGLVWRGRMGRLAGGVLVAAYFAYLVVVLLTH
jgi:cation:H+ antiporter